VGYDKGAPGQHDIHVIDRSGVPRELALPNLNDPAKDESNCVLDAAGSYIGLVQDDSVTAVFRVYDVANQTFLTLPAGKEFTSLSQFSEATRRRREAVRRRRRPGTGSSRSRAGSG